MVLSCFCVVARWLPACFVVGAISPIVLVLSAFAWVGFSALVRFRSRSFSRLPCSFLLAVLLPVCGSVSCSVAVRFLVVVSLLWFWQFLSWGLCPVVVVACVVVWCCVLFLFPLFLPKGGWVGVVGLAILLSNLKVSSGKFHRLAGRV